MFEDMYIPWTPRLRRRVPEPQPPAAQPTPATTGPHCQRTLHIARAIVAHATAPFPEIATAISNAFFDYIRGQLTINMQGEMSSWAVVPPASS